MSSFDDFVKKYTTVLENEYVAGALTLFLIVYASKVAPSLPSYMSSMFNNSIFKIIMFFLIVYMYNKKASVALVSALALMVAIMILDKMDTKTPEKMTSVSTNENDLFANLTNLINDAFDLITSPEGQIAIDETNKAVKEGHLHPAEAEMIINKIILAEEQGVSPLVAMSEKGAQEMSNIAKAVENGQIDSEEGQRLAAQIVIQENVMNIGSEQEQLPFTADEEKQILAEEISKQKQIIEENTGTKMNQTQLKQLCSQLELDFYNQKMTEISKVSGLTEFHGFDDFASLYEEL